MKRGYITVPCADAKVKQFGFLISMSACRIFFIVIIFSLLAPSRYPSCDHIFLAGTIQISLDVTILSNPAQSGNPLLEIVLSQPAPYGYIYL